VTVTVLVVLLVCAAATGSIGSRLSHEELQRLGCAPMDLFSRRAWCGVTSLAFTWGGPSFLGLLPLVLLSLGLCERAFGSRRTAGIFLATHLFASLAEAALLTALSPVLGSATSTSLLTARDVGPSAGCFGCLGAAIATWRPSRQALAAGVLLLFLAAISLWRPDPGFATSTLWISDLSHPTAALAGWGWVGLRRAVRSQPEAPRSG
jgi:hypothetical protein